jgi:hypothetical protein
VWPVGHITLDGWPCVGAFSKTVLSTCPEEAVLKVSNAQRQCKKETWPPGQVAWPADRADKWASCAQSLARAPPHSSYKYHGAPPGRKCEESEVYPPPLQGASNFNLCRVERERESQGSEGWRTSWLVRSPRSSSSVEVLSESIQVRWSFLSYSSVECGSSAGIL